MSNTYFQFKQFLIHQDRCAMKVTTDSCLFGAWVAERVGSPVSEAGSPENSEKTMLDIGTGTGLLPLMIAQKSKIRIDTVEIDKDAFEQASENITKSPWKERITVCHADVKEITFPSQYDYIISNPPFYENELTSESPAKNLARHHQGLSLPGLLPVIQRNLVPGGSFFLLLPFKRNAEIRDLMRQNDLAIRQIVFVRQSPRHDYFRILLEGTLQKNEIIEISIDEMAISHDPANGKPAEYTSVFINLLQDYYLHL